MIEGHTGPVRVRIAPSPTGDPHVGTAYIALFNLAFARRNGGQFILRIEDTDRTRSTRESEEAIFRSLRWLGLEWDEGPDKGGPFGPYRQSERKAIYEEHAGQLLATGSAYRCFCSAERLEQVREEQRARSEPPRYDRACRAIPPEEAARRAAAGEPHVVRLAMPDTGETVLRCPLRGDISYPNHQMDDQVLVKSDGFPTYHLANVVDDHLMGVTHVIRAEEWIPSTPKHIVLYRAFGWEPPTFVHMPLLRNQDRSKISKRKNPTSLDYYRRAGILPEAMVNFLGNMGYSFGDNREKFTLAEMVESFSFEKVSLGGPVFDIDKLEWLNGLYLRELTPDALLDRLQAEVFSREALARIVPLVQERIRRLEEFVPMTDFFFSGALVYEPATLLPKKVEAPAARKALAELTERLDAVVAWSEPALEEVLRGYAEEAGWKAKDLFMMVRVAVTGRSATPPLFATMAVVGKPMCQFRLRRAVDALEGLVGAPAPAKA
jgi:glutamyl-tRNA synthetase